MEDKKFFLVITYIEKFTGKIKHYYHGGFLKDECPMLVSFRAAHGVIGVPLWFDSEREAREYIYEADINFTGEEKDYWLIQEFAYRSAAMPDTAKIIFTVKSDTYPILADGETERSPGVWAHVRSIFLCNKTVAENYVKRFNDDAQMAFEHSRVERIGETN
jgi:hypothetical protein